MRVLITAQVFPPESHPTAIMVRELATRIAAAGYEVSVACGYPHHPHGRVFGGYRKRLILRERADGINIVRGWHLTAESRSIPARAAVMATQALGTAIAASGVGRPDVVISYGPPLAGPLLSAWIARRSRAKLVTVVYDIYPDVAIETGKVSNRLLVAAARAAERLMYRLSDRILVLSEGFRRTMISKGVPPSKLDVVPVWLDGEEVVPLDRVNRWRVEHGIGPEKFVVLYAGTMGIISGAAVVAGAAEKLRADSECLFLVVGDGDGKAALQAEAHRRGLTNIRFLPFQERSRLAEVQSAADVSLVTLAPGRGRTSVPSKVLGYLAAGRPVVASVDEDSDTAACLVGAGAGVVTPPGNEDALAEAVARLKGDPALRSSMGRAARAVFERDFTREAVLEHYLRVLSRVAGEAP